MTAPTKEFIKNKYGNRIKISAPIIGTCKEVYIIENRYNKSALLIENKKSISHQYRFLRSNYLQKFLFSNNLPVANVHDIFMLPDSRIAAIHSFLNGNKKTKITSDEAFRIGKIIAEFHSLSNIKFTPKYPLKLSLFHIFFALKSNLRLLRKIILRPSLQKLPRGICHFDLNLTNLIFFEKKIYLIDFDRWRYWPFAYEVLCFINHGFAAEFLQGYQSVSPLQNCEKSYLRNQLGLCLKNNTL